MEKPSDADLRNNPGIGTSKGTIKEGDELLLEGENTIEGDVENDTNALAGSIQGERCGRTSSVAAHPTRYSLPA
ncbi:hypothetical protein [Mesorhizobium sp.]|uniref:hypothetical protein n=1 Tax=Mesorhizobium sp. TaxID=1871066 RepID=UPI00258E3CBE|nr:hypothetical protein [Mesorhizobium sp.]